jgi:hypothetical protein
MHAATTVATDVSFSFIQCGIASNRVPRINLLSTRGKGRRGYHGGIIWQIAKVKVLRQSQITSERG